MKPQSRLRHVERIERVLAYLETMGSESDVSLEHLAGIACLSPFHFHRVFRLMTGEALAETVRRIRPARSLPELQASGATITAAASGSGYASSQAYGRAVKASTGGSASELRAGLEARVSRLLQPAGAGTTPLAVEIVSTEPLRLLAIRNVGAYAELNQTYEALFARVFSHHPMEALEGIYGIWHEDPRYTAPEALHFDCAIAVGDLPAPDEVETLALAGGRCARLRHVGGYDSLHDSIDRLYAHVLADEAGAGEIADRPLFVHYVDDPETRPEAEWRSDIYLPLDPA